MSIEKILRESRSLVLDTSVLLGYFMNEELSIISLLDKYIFNEDSLLTLYGHNLLMTEIYYILCRVKGISEAENVINTVEKIINIVDESWLFKKAGQIKCKYPIALSDCFSISLGLFQNCPIFFLEERELSRDVIQKLTRDFNCKIYIVS